MKFNEAIQLLEVGSDRVQKKGKIVRELQVKREALGKRFAQVVQREIIMSEQLNILRDNPEIDELELQKRAAKSAKSNKRILDNILAITGDEVKKTLR